MCDELTEESMKRNSYVYNSSYGMFSFDMRAIAHHASNNNTLVKVDELQLNYTSRS